MYVILVGAGDLGTRLIELLVTHRHDVAVIEADERAAKEAADRFDALVLHASVAKGGILDEAGADKADRLVATTGDDSANLMAMFLGSEKGIDVLISVVNDPSHKGLFERLGAHVLTDPKVIVARHLYSLVKEPAVEELFSMPRGASVFRVSLGERSSLVGKTLAESREEGLLPEGMLLASLDRGDEVLIPSGKTVLEVGDLVTVFSREPLKEALIQLFKG